VAVGRIQGDERALDSGRAGQVGEKLLAVAALAAALGAKVHGHNVAGSQMFAARARPGQGLRFAGRIERRDQSPGCNHDLLAHAGHRGCIDGVWIGVEDRRIAIVSRTSALRPGFVSGVLGGGVGQVRARLGRVHGRSRRVGQGHEIG